MHSKPIYAALVLAFLLIFAVGCSDSSSNVSLIKDEVKITEVMSNNKYYAPLQDGYCYDWMEFYNSADYEVNLKGIMISDNPNVPDKWKVPVDCIVEPHGYALIYFSAMNKVDEYGNIHASFKLSSKGESIVFSNQAGDVIQQFNIPKCDVKNISYGLNYTVSEGDSEQYYFFSEPSPLAANRGLFSANIEDLQFPESGIIINEYMTKNTYTIYDSNNQYSDWIEIHNTSSVDVNLSGYALSDKSDGKGLWFFPDNSVIPANGYLLIFCSDMLPKDSSELHADFSLSTDDVITLYSIAGKVIDSVKVIDLNPNVSCGRASDSGEFKLFASPTPGRENNTYAYEPTVKLTASPYSSLYISEAMCVSNTSWTYKNDFIEIHNAAAQAVSLKDYGLSKNAAGAAFKFPDITIQPNAYAVVYCTGKNYSVAGKTMQAAFKLNQGGEEIFLFDAGGHIIDSMNTGKQTYGHSSGRLATEKNVIYVFGSPTPNASNESSKTYLGYAPMPQISSNGGYLQKGTKITISAPEDCNIYYTTTGAAPTSSSTKYSNGLTINKTTVIKAIAAKKGYLASQISTVTILVEKEHSIPVMSVSSDPDGLFSDKTGILSGAYGGLVKGQPNYKSDEKRTATFEYFIDGKKAASFSGAVRGSGEYSRSAPQKALAVIMSEVYGVNETYFPYFGKYSPEKMESFLLRPSGQDWSRSHLRDEFCSRILRDSSVDCDYQEAQPVALYINGKYWGLYYLREKLNEDYLVNKYNMTKGKIDIVKWEKIVQSGSAKDYIDLMSYCESHDLSQKKYYNYVCSKIDVDSLIDWWIFETYIANNDTGNIRCYRDQNDGKWHWMLFDMDNAFFLTTYKTDYIEKFMFGPYHGESQCKNSLIRRLLKNKDFQSKFITAYCHHLKTTFAPERLNKILDELSAEIKDELPRQTNRWSKPTISYQGYNVSIIKKIINQKPALAKEQIKKNFHISEKTFQKYYDAA